MVAMTSSQHVYEVTPRKDHRGVDLISDALPFGRVLSRTRRANRLAFMLCNCYSASSAVEPRPCNDVLRNAIASSATSGQYSKECRVHPSRFGLSVIRSCSQFGTPTAATLFSKIVY